MRNLTCTTIFLLLLIAGLSAQRPATNFEPHELGINISTDTASITITTESPIKCVDYVCDIQTAAYEIREVKAPGGDVFFNKCIIELPAIPCEWVDVTLYLNYLSEKGMKVKKRIQLSGI